MIRTRYRINFESTKQQREARSILFNKIVIWKSFGQRRRQRERIEVHGIGGSRERTPIVAAERDSGECTRNLSGAAERESGAATKVQMQERQDQSDLRKRFERTHTTVRWENLKLKNPSSQFLRPKSYLRFVCGRVLIDRNRLINKLM